METTFSRHERLKSRKTIARLFKEGNAFLAYPLRVVWLPVEVEQGEGEKEVAPVQLAITVPKRTFKTAVARNRLKRQIREAYRLHKSALYEKLAARSAPPLEGQREASSPPLEGQGEARAVVAMMLMYIGKEALPFAEIEAGVKKMVRKM